MRYLSLCFLLFSNVISAENIGVRGTVYPIAEQDFLKFIESRLVTLQQNGDIERHQKQFQARALASADRPAPVSGLSKAQETRVFYWDPTVMLSDKPFNPLSQVPLTRTLLFYDGDDLEQVKWAQQTNEASRGKTLMILVKGSVRQQSKQFARAIYFDQYGKLTQKFGIRYIPARVEQENLRLRIEEVKL